MRQRHQFELTFSLRGTKAMPTAMESQETTKTRHAGKALAIAGLIGQVVVLIAAFCSGFIGALTPEFLRSIGFVGPDAVPTAEVISSVLFEASIWIFIFSWIALALALFWKKFRAPWFFWILAAAAAFLMWSNPIGILMGAFLAYWLVSHRYEFFGKPKWRRKKS